MKPQNAIGALAALSDSFGRTLTTLRVSVTDRCDLRCVYCMPAKGAAVAPKPDLLSAAELVELLGLFTSLGIGRLKFTGGEPLLRTDLEGVLASCRGKAEISLTTNATLLKGRAKGLKQAGLERLTISLDSLNPATYARMTRGGDLRRVLEGLAEAQSLGFSRLKINAVMLDQPMEELVQLAALSVAEDIDVRFIEYMPVSFAVEPVKAHKPADLLAALEAAYGPLEGMDRETAASPARSLRIKGARGRLGLIASVTEPFCGACDRLRLQANGFLRLCMARPDGVNLRELLRSGADLAAEIKAAAWRKPAGHAFYKEAPLQGSQMSGIGG